jgi:hypothetical protein
MKENLEEVLDRLKGMCNRDPSDMSCLGCLATGVINDLVSENEVLRRQIKTMEGRDERYLRFVAFFANEMSQP